MTKNFSSMGILESVTVTREEWKNVHSDYKHGRLGHDAKMMILDTNGKTVIVPALERRG